MFLSEAQIERAINGEPYPVAGFAKMLRDGRDKTDTEVGAGYPDITCRPTAGNNARYQLDDKYGGIVCGAGFVAAVFR